MFKRRDWVHLHGQEGEDSSDDDSSGASELTEAATSSVDTSSSSRNGKESAEDANGASSGSSSEEVEDIDASRRLQDLSEDDFEANDEPEVDVSEQYEHWMQASSSQLLKGQPLKCKFCSGALLLNSNSLKQHLQSKRHKKLQPRDYADIPVTAADGDHEEESEGETHAERLERLRQQSVPATKLTSSQRRRQKRKLQAQHKQMQPAQKRCGKRQRAELKAQVFQQADEEGSKVTSKASAHDALLAQD